MFGRLKEKIVAAIFLILAANQLPAQDVPQFSVSGTITDSQTREPLPNVNVYLAGTMIGTTSNLQGEFMIRNVPAGTYDLVVSMVGYERQIINLRLFRPPATSLDIRLKEKAFETPPVEIVAKDPADWRRGLGKFTAHLFGRTRNGEECRIVNPEVLDFEEGKETGKFRASARDPLVIENRALGYRLELILQVFSFDAMAFKYGGVVRFEEVQPIDQDQAERWRNNRLRSYKGSLPHFLLSLVKNRLQEEGYQVLSTKELPFRRSRIPFREAIRVDEIVKPGEFPFERLLRFRDYLEVRYKEEPPEAGFRDFWTETASWKLYENDLQQISWLSMDGPFLRITTEGRLFDPYALKTYGYWSFERIGEWLPMEYRQD